MSNKKALLFGCNYEGEYQLSGCINDVEKMKRYLAYKGWNIKLHKEPTSALFYKKCLSVINNLKDRDILYFHFSGHGFQVKDENGDESDGLDEAILLADDTGIKDDYINEIFVGRTTDKFAVLFMVFDSCHSGTMCDLRYTYKRGNNYTINEKYDETKPFIISLSGCTDSQCSMDTVMNGIPQGALTGTMLSVLAKCDENTLLCDFVDMIRDTLEINGYGQYPLLCSSRPIGSIDLSDIGFK
jgi:hypothetical protein